MDFHSYKTDVIRHEVGHWTTAKALGFDVGDISIKIFKNSASLGHEASARIFPNRDLPDISNVQCYLKSRIAILYSGVAAQLSVRAGYESDDIQKLLSTDGEDDNRKIEELVLVLRGIVYSGSLDRGKELDQKSEIMSECWGAAEGFVKNNAEKIDLICRNISGLVVMPNAPYIFPESSLTQWWAEA